MLVNQQGKHFYIFDYFLDGEFLKWEECQSDFPVCGQTLAIELENGNEIVTQVVEIEPISENESRIFLSSC